MLGRAMTAAPLYQLALAALSGGVLRDIAMPIWRRLRSSSDHEFTHAELQDRLIDALRRALDKGRLREDALAQVLGVLIFGLRQIENLSPALTDAMERAIVILKQAQTQLQKISDGEPL